MEKGKLRIDITSNSEFLASILPIEIRDANHRQVVVNPEHRTFELDPGLYSVRAVLNDGRLNEQYVKVAEGKTESLKFQLTKGDTPLEGTATANAPPARILELVGAEHTSTDGNRMIFVPTEPLTGVPQVTLEAADHRYTLSLPVNPMANYPENSCEIRVVSPTRGGVHIAVQLAPERMVASTLERMVEAGHVEQYSGLAEQGSEMLAEKYRDPVGAALGGLVLHRLSKLEHLQSWVENLARDFAWLPDGKVLLAALLRYQEPARGLEVLLEAAERRMVFSDGLSLTLELLRRWPDPASQTRREGILDSLSHQVSTTLWGEVVLQQKV